MSRPLESAFKRQLAYLPASLSFSDSHFTAGSAAVPSGAKVNENNAANATTKTFLWRLNALFLRNVVLVDRSRFVAPIALSSCKLGEWGGCGFPWSLCLRGPVLGGAVAHHWAGIVASRDKRVHCTIRHCRLSADAAMPADFVLEHPEQSRHRNECVVGGQLYDTFV